jgi:protein O-mannosyl-transferase
MAKSKRHSRPTPSPPPRSDGRRPAALPRLGRFAWPRDAILSVGLLLLIAAAYWPVAGNAFINYDDDDYVVDNEFVRQGLSVNSLAWAMTSFDRANWHPLTWISHMLDCQLFGVHPAGHHVVNLLLHAANSLLLYNVLLRMTCAVWPSIVVAALFAVHPLHVESVAWVAERKDVLSTLFGLLALEAWLRYLARPGFFRYAAVMFWFAASLMSKPMWVTFPFLLLLLDFWPLGRVRRRLHIAPTNRTEDPAGTCDLRTLVLEKLPLVLLSAASCVVTMLAQSGGKAVVSLQRLSIADRLAVVAEGYCSYLWKMAVPLNLAPIYPLPKSINYYAASACGALLTLATVLVIWAGRKRKYLPVGWFFFLGTLVPVIGIVQVGLQSIADRYTYLPSVGIFIAVAWSAGSVVVRWPWLKCPIALLAAAALTACAFLTSAQVCRWASTETLFTHTAAVTANNAVALTNLGLVAIQKQDYAEADRLLHEALRIEVNDIDAMGNLATMYTRQKKYDDALATYKQMLRNNLSPDKACHAYTLMAGVYGSKGDLSNRAFYLAKAAELQPASAELHGALALSEQMLGKTQEALDHYAIVLRLAPGESKALNNIAWIYATHPEARFRNGIRAVELLRPLAATPDCDPNVLDTLAAAYAETGQFETAVQTIETALSLARGKKNPPESIADMEKRAALYKKQQPYRDEALRGPIASHSLPAVPERS